MKKPLQSTMTGTFKIKVDGELLDITVTVPTKPVKPYRMLPVIQKMANTLVDRSVRAAEEAGEKISCRKGCGACCRQVVPIAEIEAYQLAELVNKLPEPRRTEVRQRFANAYSHFSRIGWFDHIGDLANASRDDLARRGLEYSREGVPCPFLVDESCSIHLDRPVSCREYLVTSPAENCSAPTAQTVKLIDITLKPSRPLMRLGQTKPNDGARFVPLILALKWVETHPDAFAEKTGDRWMADFFQDLTGAELPGSLASE